VEQLFEKDSAFTYGVEPSITYSFFLTGCDHPRPLSSSSIDLNMFFNRFEDALRNHVMLHDRQRVEMGLGQKFIYPPRVFV
jgi:hypothetical protein